jgi:hypothetical protein
MRSKSRLFVPGVVVVFTSMLKETSRDPGERLVLYGTVIRESTGFPPKNALVPSNVTFRKVPLFAPTTSFVFVPSGHVEITAA